MRARASQQDGLPRLPVVRARGSGVETPEMGMASWSPKLTKEAPSLLTPSLRCFGACSAAQSHHGRSRHARMVKSTPAADALHPRIARTHLGCTRIGPNHRRLSGGAANVVEPILHPSRANLEFNQILL